MPVFESVTTLAAEPSAGGAELGQVFLATFLIGGAYAALAVLAVRHRSGKTTLLGRAADGLAGIMNLPNWAALPLMLAAVSLVVALLGMYWDISIHIDEGRDAGPLANIAHYPILLGLMGIFAAGWLAVFLPRGDERPGPAPIRLVGDWYAPIGGVLMFLCGGFALVAFPLDDVWHRIFGQDVTLWGPTHLMLLGGAAMTLIGQGVLLSEAMWTRSQRAAAEEVTVQEDEAAPRIGEALLTLRRIGIAGGLLIGVSVYQAEFDFGVPQFRAVFEPAMLALAAGFALTAARMWIGRGGALAAVLFFTVVRGAVSVFVGPVIGETTPLLPLYLVEALAIEALALAFGTQRTLRFGAIAGLAAGTVGFAAQWAWSQLVMPVPWTEDILPEGIFMAVAAGLAGGILGSLLASGLKGELPPRPLARGAFAASMLVICAGIVNGLITEEPRGAEATVTVTETKAAPDREGEIAVRFDPDDFANGASWANLTSWQGGGLELTDLKEGDDGVWRTEGAVPLDGDWKSILRVHNGRELAAVPVWLPEDPAIPAPEVPAEGTFTRAVTTDKAVLQREVKDDVPGWIWAVATGFVALLYLGFITILAWGVGRVGRAKAGEPPALLAGEPKAARKPRTGAAPGRPRVA
jgi:hypothetical protein